MRVWVCVCVYVCLVQYTHNAYASQLCCLLKYPVLFALVVLVIVLVYLVMASTLLQLHLLLSVFSIIRKLPTSYTSKFVYIIGVCIQVQSGFDWQHSSSFPNSSIQQFVYMRDIYDDLLAKLRSLLSLVGLFLYRCPRHTAHTSLSLSPAKGDIQVYAIYYSQLCWHFNKLSSSIHSSLLNCFPISI